MKAVQIFVAGCQRKILPLRTKSQEIFRLRLACGLTAITVRDYRCWRLRRSQHIGTGIVCSIWSIPSLSQRRRPSAFSNRHSPSRLRDATFSHLEASRFTVSSAVLPCLIPWLEVNCAQRNAVCSERKVSLAHARSQRTLIVCVFDPLR
jgi:hypothetical protein